MREDMRPEPEDSYGIAKYVVERELAATHKMFGLPYVIFRPHNVYGELQNIGDRYRNVLGIFINQIMRGEPLSIFGDGEQTRAFSYVGDIIPAIASAPKNEAAHQEVFNIGADTPYSVNFLAEAVRRAMDVPDHPIIHHPPRQEVLHAFSDHAKMHEVFGVSPSTSLEVGIQTMVEWARAHGPRQSAPFSAIEIERNLPPSWRGVTE
jgi:UDP-glucose 4-epimerase